MKKARRTSKAYQNYRAKFYAEKKAGNIKVGRSVYTYDQYLNATLGEKNKKTGKRDKSKAISDKEILKNQTVLHSKAEKNKVWRYYKKLRKAFQRGKKLDQEDTFFGENIEEEEGLGYHYNLSGLMNTKRDLHFLISFRVDIGEDREKVLSDYGY